MKKSHRKRGIIRQFTGRYACFDPFHISPFTVKDKRYDTLAHYLWSTRPKSEEVKELIRVAASPRKARMIGMSLPEGGVVDKWEEKRFLIMMYGIREKLFQHQRIMHLLLSTGNDYLQHGNRRGDTYWGYDFDQKKGCNALGKIYMDIRDGIVK